MNPTPSISENALQTQPQRAQEEATGASPANTADTVLSSPPPASHTETLDAPSPLCAIQEFVDSRGVAIRVDREAGVIRGVKLLGLQSRNGRDYPAKTLARAASLYEEAKVNVNHAKGNPGGPRDYQDRIGLIRRVSLDPEQGLFGDFHFNPKHALAEQLIWDAEHAPQKVGFSHNVEARLGRQGERIVVEAITRVQSVDLVADPATTGGLFESAASPLPMPPSPASPSPASPSPASPSPVAEQRAEIDRLQRELQRLTLLEQNHAQRELAQRLLREFDLPEADSSEPWAKTIISPTFFQSLLAAADEPAMRELVEERANLVKTLGVGNPSGEALDARPQARDQHLIAATDPIDRQRFLEAIT